MAGRDLYGILGVARGASEQEIRKAYRALARKHHPDRNPDNKEAEERFKDASYAREVLLNKEKRKLYDEFGEPGLREGFNVDAYRQYQSRAASGGPGFGGFGGLEDLFNRTQSGQQSGGWGAAFQDFLGDDAVETILGRNRRGGRQRGRDVVSELTIDFMEAVLGAERELSVQAPGQPARAIKVRIPAGVRDGGRIRLRGQGEQGGDLVLHVHVGEHPFYRRENDDLLLNLPVTVGEAFRGAKVQVPTPEGPVSMQLPKGVRSGAKLRLRGRGVRRGTEAAGDLYAVVQIVLPAGAADAPELEAAIDQIEQRYGESPRKGIGE
ncbi:MAG TPA: DnaJ C-terminal domain-containing protein [Polyangiales bacterium]|nr:DnaJ C-terminal domain-containing protein [Polyangiales bacterium]